MWGRCPEENVGYVVPAPPRRPNPSKSEFGRERDPIYGAPIRLNLDRFGLPKDYATYVWLTYHKVVKDESPERLAFLGGRDDDTPPSFGVQTMMR